MRYAADHKQETHAKLLAAAAKQIRANGPGGVAVADVMKAAGLTHGGFYAHFKSKDALVAAAIGEMFAGSRRRWAHETENRAPAEGLAAYVDFYLSAAHRDARGTGCPMPALAGELPRLTTAARTAFAAGRWWLIERLVEHLRALDPTRSAADAESIACSVMAELVGALALARAEPDATRSDRILFASKRAVRTRLGLS